MHIHKTIELLHKKQTQQNQLTLLPTRYEDCQPTRTDAAFLYVCSPRPKAWRGDPLATHRWNLSTGHPNAFYCLSFFSILYRNIQKNKNKKTQQKRLETIASSRVEEVQEKYQQLILIHSATIRPLKMKRRDMFLFAYIISSYDKGILYVKKLHLYT